MIKKIKNSKKTGSKLIFKEFILEPYGQFLCIFIGTRKQYVDYLKKVYDIDIDPEEPDADAEYCFYKWTPKNPDKKYRNGKRSFNAIWLRHFDWTIQDQCLMSHEILHCVLKLLNRVGMIYSDESEEAYTYLFQTTMFKIWEEFKPKKQTIKITKKVINPDNLIKRDEINE